MPDLSASSLHIFFFFPSRPHMSLPVLRLYRAGSGMSTTSSALIRPTSSDTDTLASASLVGSWIRYLDGRRGSEKRESSVYNSKEVTGGERTEEGEEKLQYGGNSASNNGDVPVPLLHKTMKFEDAR
mmetsp:Transcript_19069/g.48781  ORF Transcript_19069/g.48781 Transcript_19069/m.48781 type:complete len:127 (-) Transcript_19069:39-419(-)